MEQGIDKERREQTQRTETGQCPENQDDAPQGQKEYPDRVQLGERAVGPGKERRKREVKVAFILREIHNQIKQVIHKSSPQFEKAPKSQLQGGILGYLYHHRDGPVYQKDLEKEFRISRATATNTLQVMERDGLIMRKALDRDARLKRIQMTDEAFQNHRQIEAHMEMMERCMLEGMTEAEKAELYRLLGMLQDNLERLAERFSGQTDEDYDSIILSESCGTPEDRGSGPQERK